MAIDLRANQGAALGLRPGAEAELTTIKLPSGARFTVASKVAPQFQAFLSELESSGYKINPEKSGGYNDRNIGGTSKKSQHAFGNAIDLNWDINPQGQSKHDLPGNISDIAAKHGIAWGGNWKNPDPMHFEVSTLNAGDPSSGGSAPPSSTASASSPTSSAAASPKEGEMLNMLAALGSSGNLMAGLGKMFGSQGMQAAGGSDNLFGSIANMFGAQGQGGQQPGQQQQGNPAGDANMKLASAAQQAAATPMGQQPQVYQRKPVDLSNLMKILQQRSQMGVGGRQPGPGLGA